MESKQMLSLHGFMADPSWESPKLVADSKEMARPGYNSSLAQEYLDSKGVLKQKIKLLAELIKKSENLVVYTGAGISMAAGINDYATKSKNTVTRKTKSQTINRKKAIPTKSHYVMVELYKAKYLKHWIQQNHDGLAQKAGFPQKELNEIHGSWFDNKNPVILMDDKLKDDLFNKLLEWEEKCDLCLSLGTSMCGKITYKFRNEFR
jgi:NAD-dependent SIR2 family protein deacetylase